MAAVSRFLGIKAIRLMKYGSGKHHIASAKVLSNRLFSNHPFTTISSNKILVKFLIQNNIKRSICLTSSLPSKVVQFKLSDIGEGIREVNVKEWFVKEGDKVCQFENICEVQSDKASVTITSRYDGTIQKLHHELDAIALVGEPLVDILLDEGSEAAEASEDTAADSSDSDSSSSSDEEEDDTATNKFLATPAVRNLAAQNSVKLQDVTASGKKGRILKDDVVAYMNSITSPSQQQQQQNSAAATPQPLVQPTTTTAPLATTTPPQVLPLILTRAEAPKDRSEAITGMRKAMVKAMTAANDIPHFCFCDQINVTQLVDLKSHFKEVALKYGIKFSYTSIFIKAASLALATHPLLNSSVDEECKVITYKGSHNIGVAIDSSHGLVVPNIKNVASLSVLEVARELERLNSHASMGKLGPADLAGGTFTISNVGMIGGTYTSPVIFAPQVVIGALGSIVKQPWYTPKVDIQPAHLMNVSWSADHRVVDGATMARFSNLWKSFLETPASFLLHLR